VQGHGGRVACFWLICSHEDPSWALDASQINVDASQINVTRTKPTINQLLFALLMDDLTFE
jgi:hypothetical protein